MLLKSSSLFSESNTIPRGVSFAIKKIGAGREKTMRHKTPECVSVDDTAKFSPDKIPARQKSGVVLLLN